MTTMTRGRRFLPWILAGMWVLELWPESAYAIHPATVLKKMEKDWNAVDTLRARVTQIYRSEGERDETVYTGVLSVRRPRCLRFDFNRSATPEVTFASPEATADFTVFTTNGEFLYEFDRTENTLSQDTIEGLNALPFLKAVAGIEGFSEERFNEEFYVVSPVLEERAGSAAAYLLRVRPRPRYAERHDAFDLWVGSEDSLPRKILLYLPQQTVEVRLEGYVVNQPIPIEEFEVNLPPGIQYLRRAEQF